MTTSLQVSRSALLKFLDNDLIQNFGTHGIEFYPRKWREEFNTNLERGGIWHKDTYRLICPKLEKIIYDNENELQIRRSQALD